MKSLYDCQHELRSIIRELRSIEWDVRNGASGIGQNLCADCIGRIADKYDGVLTRLQNVDTNFLADWAMGSESE